MLKHKWIWAIIVVLLIAASPSIIHRYQAEQASDHYDVIIPYEEIVQVSKQSSLSSDEVFEKLKEAGLTNVSIAPVTLKDLKENSVVLVYEQNELSEALSLTAYYNDVDLDNEGFYISIPEDAHYQELLEDALSPEVMTIADREFYFVSSKESPYTLESPIGYDPSVIEEIESHGLNYTFRLLNDSSTQINRTIVDQLKELKTDNVMGLLPAGTEIFGFGQAHGVELLDELEQVGYHFYFVESSKFKGYDLIKKVTDYDVIRLHSMDVNRESKLTTDKMIERSVRAVKERNIKSIFYHVQTTGDMKTNLNNTVDFLTGVQETMPDHYKLDTVKPVEQVNVPSWAYALILLAGILFVYIASEILFTKFLRIVATAIMVALAAGFFLLDRIVFIQAFALIIAVVAPTYAVIKAAHGENTLRGLAVQYLKAAGITVVGIIIMISLLNGNKFMSGFEVFRGVILVYLLPLLGVFLHVVIKVFNIDLRDMKSSLPKVKSLIASPVRYGHLIIVVIMAIVILFYVSRSGNGGTATQFELTFRQWLEDLLYARPRTKEIFIGFPFFVLAIYALKTNKIVGRILLIPGVIGFLSIMNTFSHLHIGLNMSILRTVYGLVFGFVIGLVFIGIYKLVVKYWARLMKRWS